MAKLLRDATVAERNAAFNAAHPLLVGFIQKHAPGFLQGQLMAGLDGAEGREAVLQTIDAALHAAEQVREQSEAAQAAKAAPHTS